MAKKDKQIQKITQVPDRLGTLLADIRGLILSARNTVARGIDLVQVHTNFEIGRHIVEHEQHGKARAAYGHEVIGQLAERLTEEFGKGYSKRNLELVRQFYVLYSDRRHHIAQSLTAQLPSSRKTQSPIAQILPDVPPEVDWKIPEISWKLPKIQKSQTLSDLFQKSEKPSRKFKIPLIWQTASAKLSRIKKSQTVSGKLPCPKTLISMPGSINCICPAKTN
jgi:hypothetical protein